MKQKQSEGGDLTIIKPSLVTIHFPRSDLFPIEDLKGCVHASMAGLVNEACSEKKTQGKDESRVL